MLQNDKKDDEIVTISGPNKGHFSWLVALFVLRIIYLKEVWQSQLPCRGNQL